MTSCDKKLLMFAWSCVTFLGSACATENDSTVHLDSAATGGNSDGSGEPDLVVSALNIPPETEPGTELWFIPIDQPGTQSPAVLGDGRIAFVDAVGTVRLVNQAGSIVYEMDFRQQVGSSGSVAVTDPIARTDDVIVGVSFHDQDVTCDYGGLLLSIPLQGEQPLPLLDGSPEIFGPPAITDNLMVWSTVGYQWNQFGDLCAKGVILSSALAKSGKTLLVPSAAKGISFANDGTIRTVSDPDVVAAYSPDLQELWSISLGGLGVGEVALRSDSSSVLTLGSKLIILSADGTMISASLWSRSVSKLTGQPAIGPDGTIFVSATIHGGGSQPHVPALAAATSSGVEKWTYVARQPKVTASSGVTCGTPVVGTAGSVFAACGDGSLIALDQKNGQLRWKVEGVATAMSPTLLPDGVLIVTGIDGYRAFYAGPDTLATGVWARYRGNNRSTGSIIEEKTR